MSLKYEIRITKIKPRTKHKTHNMLQILRILQRVIRHTTKNPVNQPHNTTPSTTLSPDFGDNLGYNTLHHPRRNTSKQLIRATNITHNVHITVTLIKILCT